MFIKHPHIAALIEISRYGLIEVDPVGPNVLFYINPLDDIPQFSVLFSDQKERDAWFQKLANRYTRV